MQTLVYRRNGIDLHVSARGRVITTFLYGKRFEGRRPYRKILPAGLASFRTSKADVIALLGQDHAHDPRSRKGRDRLGALINESGQHENAIAGARMRSRVHEVAA